MAELVCHECGTEYANPECPKCGPMAKRVEALESELEGREEMAGEAIFQLQQEVKQLDAVADALLVWARAHQREFDPCPWPDCPDDWCILGQKLYAAGKLPETPSREA